MNTLGIILLFVALVIILLNIGMFVLEWKEEIELPNTPKDIYEEHDVNWFGAVILYLLTIIFLPIIYLFKFIYFIFTVGRKD